MTKRRASANHATRAEEPADFKQARRRKARLHDPLKNGDLPPHSLDGEQGVLGCILLSADCLPACSQTFKNSGVFYDLRHRTLYEVLLSMHDRRQPIDTITVKQALEDDGKLEDAGGLAYVAGLPDVVPSAANLDYYIQIVREKYALRCLEGFSIEVVSRVRECHGDVDLLLDQVARDFDILCRPQQRRERSPRTDPKFLRSLDLTDKSKVLLGDDWINKGGSCLISAPSGIGKSVLEIQMAIMWAAGLSFWGIRPPRPLKSVIIFTENDDRDNARALRGVLEKLEADFIGPEEIDLVDKNLAFRECQASSGEDFVRLARDIASEESPDLMWLDPAAAYVGDDLSKQSVIAQFFRNGIHPIAKEHGFAWMIINHFTKPSSEGAKGRSKWTASDHQYRGAGSYDLAGWARAGLTISEHAGGLFEFRFAKRGKLSGACHPNGEPSLILWARHAQEGISWQQVEPPSESSAGSGSDAPEGKPKPEKLTKPEQVNRALTVAFYDSIPGDGESMRKLINRIIAWMQGKQVKPKMVVSYATGQRAVELMLNAEKLSFDGQLYRKGTNA